MSIKHIAELSHFSNILSAIGLRKESPITQRKKYKKGGKINGVFSRQRASQQIMCTFGLLEVTMRRNTIVCPKLWKRRTTLKQVKMNYLQLSLLKEEVTTQSVFKTCGTE